MADIAPKIERATMPIPKDVRRKHYGPKWEKLSAFLREQAGQRCECRGECGTDHGGRCQAEQGKPLEPPAPAVDLWGEELEVEPGKPQQLTVAHLNQIAGDDRPENLRVMCAGCHLRYDRFQHARNRRAREEREALEQLEAAGQARLPFE